ncbi:MAG: aminotransferase class I/II-fold pyridoxal phosphate-dependent enzyme [Gemmatimonadales bacterium]
MTTAVAGTAAGAPSGAVIQGARNRPADDPLFKLHREATERAAKGESVLNATLGSLTGEDGKLAVMPSVLETLAKIDARAAAGYAPVAGIPAFLDATIADVFGDTPLARQAVAVATPGGTGAVYQSVLNFLEPGQKLLTTNFHWGPYAGVARGVGRDVETFAMFTEGGAFDVDALAAGLDRLVDTQGRALVVLNFPCHNPTGYSLDQDEWRRVVDAVARAAARGPVSVLLDVAYFTFGGRAARTWIDWVPGLLEGGATALIAWTASKAFTQYGARVGSLIAVHPDDDERTQIKNALGFTCRSTWSNSNHLGQRAITELLTKPELRRRADAERAELSDLLGARIRAFNEGAKAVGLETPRYDSGFFSMVYTPDAERTAAKMRDLGVFVLPLKGAVRVALCGVPLADIPRLVDALAAGVRAAG